MKVVRSVVLSLTLGGLVAASALACGGSVEQPQTTASAATKAPVAQNTHGMVKLFGDALTEVALRPDQRSEIEKLASDAEARHAPLAAEHKQIMSTLADQVERGAIERASLEASAGRLAEVMKRVSADDRAAVARLHALLDPEQRNAFVDAVERQVKARRGEHGKHAKHGMHGGFGPMKQLADDMKLSDEQRAQIHDALRASMKDARKAHGPPERGPGRGDHHPKMGPGGFGGGKRALEAFRQDKLDLDRVAPAHPPAGRMIEHVLDVAEKVLPILTPEQRKIAADKLRSAGAAGEGPILVH